MEDTVLDEHVLASLRVAAVAVRTFVPDGHALYCDVLAEQWVDDPERRVEQLHSLDQDALTAYEVDELRAQALSQSKLTLVKIHSVFSLLQQFGTRTQALCFLGHTLLEVELLGTAHRPPGLHVSSTVDGTFAGDGDVGSLIGVDARRIVPASQTFP